MPGSARWPSRGVFRALALLPALVEARSAEAAVNPDWARQQELLPAGAKGAEAFGQALAVSDQLLVVGAPARAGGGAVYVYDRQGVQWSPARGSPLTLAPQGSDGLGCGVAVFGQTVVATAPTAFGATSASVRVYEKSGATWSEVAVLTNPEPSDTSFGYSVAIGAAGILVGAPFVGDGVVYWYTRGPSGWATIPVGTVDEPLAAGGGEFGTVVAIDGTTALVSAPFANDGQGIVFSYSFDGASWVHATDLVNPSDEVFTLFGYAVALSGDRAAVGALDARESTGAAYVFERTANVWDGGESLAVVEPVSGGQFGFSVAVGATSVLVGRPYMGAGAGYVFTKQAGTWQAATPLEVTAGQPGDNVGTSVAMLGNVALVGAPTRVNGSVQAFALVDGSACEEDADCEHEHCREGICCDQSCASACQSCLAARKQQGPDGVCGIVQDGTDPLGTCDESADACGTTGLCNIHGECAFGEVGTSCGGPVCQDTTTLRVFMCDGEGTCKHADAGCGLCTCSNGACNNGCSSDNDCVDTAFCDINNQCQERSERGFTCSRDAECESGHCADGVCCDQACSGQCEACNEGVNAGKCVAVSGEPRAGRQSCVRDETNPCGNLSCNGQTREQCAVYPDVDVACELDDCKQAICGGEGACVCATEPRCNETKTRAFDKAGRATDCAPFVCRGGACLKECESTNDCAEGLPCDDATKTCEQQVALRQSSGCALNDGTENRNGLPWLLLTVAFLRRRVAMTHSRKDPPLCSKI